MSEHIFDLQDREWKEYQKKAHKAKEQQGEDEWMIRCSFGQPDKELPPEWLNKIERDRKQLEEEWGFQGRRFKELAERQEREREREFSRVYNPAAQSHARVEDSDSEREPHFYSNDEMEEMFRDYMATDELTRRQMAEYAHEEKRKTIWATLTGEVNAIKNFYERKGQEIPQATQHRMAKRIVTFRREWQGYQPETPLDQWENLTAEDLSSQIKQFQSWQDLYTSHAIIQDHYGGINDVPDTVNEWMDQEVQEFNKEIDRHNSAFNNDDKADGLTAFRERLQAIRERQHMKKPKPH